MATEGWTHGNTIATIALIVSFIFSSASLIISIITNNRARTDREKANVFAVVVTNFHVQAARRAADNLKSTVICTAKNSNLVTESCWKDIEVHIGSLKLHIDKASTLSSSLEDQELLLKIVKAGLVAHRHSSEMQDQAATITEDRWLNKQEVLIKALSTTIRKANNFLNT